ncbi:MAG: AAA family ATPase [Methanospirillum sp.]
MKPVDDYGDPSSSLIPGGVAAPDSDKNEHKITPVPEGVRSERSAHPKSVLLDGVKLYLFEPFDTRVFWVGQEMVLRLLIASWLRPHPLDRSMTPVLVGPPGCGKTTLARFAASQFGRPVYTMNCTADMRPEDLLVMTVLSPTEKFRYQASSLVSAMITGGICILDEGNRMPERSWASLAPLLDDRRYVESVAAGMRIHAHPDFRLVVTMNDDSSTFNLPDYIVSRLKPVLPVSFPERDELIQILAYHFPRLENALAVAIVEHLTARKESGTLDDYSIRDAINIAELTLHLEKNRDDALTPEELVAQNARYIVKPAEEDRRDSRFRLM